MGIATCLVISALVITVLGCLYLLRKNDSTCETRIKFCDNDWDGYKLLPDYDTMLFKHPFKWNWDEYKTYKW